jgi:hypothetical protein
MPLLLAGTLGSAHGLARAVAFLLHPLLATNHNRRGLPELEFQSFTARPTGSFAAAKCEREWLVGDFVRLDFCHVLGCLYSR